MKPTINVKQTTVSKVASVVIQPVRIPTPKQSRIAAEIRKMDDVELSELSAMRSAATSYWVAWKSAADEADYLRTVTTAIKDTLNEKGSVVGKLAYASAIVDNALDVIGVSQKPA